MLGLKMSKPSIAALYLSISILIPIFATSAYGSTREEILSLVDQFTEILILEAYPDASRYKINIRAPDPRFSFEHCHEPKLSQSGDQVRARMLVKIDCGNSSALHLAVDIAIFNPVVVSSTAISRKTLLGPADIILKEVNILTNTRAMIFDPDQVIGKELKRAVRVGTVISPTMLLMPILIKRGDNVVIIAKKGQLIVRVTGTALASGTMGQQIAVRNTASERTVKGWVNGPGEILVPM
ncbi:MAG: flagella basal body P-ring formation protein FlgA [Candidatus Azotimanducaceae bacterium]|jgi:flagella basal body P-ring formation protein FlgA